LDGKYQTAEELSDFYGDRFILNESEGLACRYSVTMEDTRPVQARVKFLGPTGAVLVDSIETIESNDRWMTYKTPIKTDGGAPPSGAYSVEISFPNDPALPTLTDFCGIAVGVSPFCFTAARFAPASDEQIAAFEAGLPYRLCDDLKSWLKGPNGAYIQWPYIDLWKQLGAEAKTAFDDDIEAIRKNRWEIVINEIAGLPEPWLGIQRGLIKSFEKWTEKPHLRMLYPVAKNAAGTGFNGYCQLATGSHRGRIVELLTSIWHLDVLSNVQDGKRSEGRGKKVKTFEYPFRTLAEATPDQVIDTWINEGMIRLTNMNFEEFSRRVIAAHEQEFLRLFSKYFGG
jgi:hypothetical protein